MGAGVIDPYKVLATLKATGKDANFTAEEIVNAIGVSQQGADLLTVPIFDARINELDAKVNELRAVFDAKINELRADIRADVKASQMQNLLWLAGIMLVSNGAVITVLARAAKLY